MYSLYESLIKSRTLFVIFCFHKPVGFRSQNFFCLGSLSKIFWARLIKFPDFFSFFSGFFFFIIKLRTLFAISCFQIAQDFARKKKIFSDRAQTFFGHVSSNFPTFFFLAGFFFFFFFFVFRLLRRVLSGTISSGPVKDTKNLKICPGR